MHNEISSDQREVGSDAERQTSARLDGGLGVPVVLKAGFWVCVVIAIAVVVRRVVALSTPPNPGLAPQLASLDKAFAGHAALTLVHILTALLLVILLPFLFWQRTRDAVWPERLVFPLGVVVGLTAYAMSRYAVGGWLERSAVLFFNTLYLFALYRAFVAARRADRAEKHRWLLRAVAILLGIATTRPVMGVFFATASVTHLTPRQFFGIAFWIGFSLNTVVIEWWLWRAMLPAAASRRRFSATGVTLPPNSPP